MTSKIPRRKSPLDPTHRASCGLGVCLWIWDFEIHPIQKAFDLESHARRPSGRVGALVPRAHLPHSPAVGPQPEAVPRQAT